VTVSVACNCKPAWGRCDTTSCFCTAIAECKHGKRMTAVFKKTCVAVCQRLKVFFTKYRSHSASEEVL